MKNLSYLLALAVIFTAVFSLIPSAFAVAEESSDITPQPLETQDMPEAEQPAQPERMDSPVFAVFVPEQVDHQWYWWYYTAEAQLIVQNAIEKALVRAGFELADISSTAVFNTGSVADLFSKDIAVQI